MRAGKADFPAFFEGDELTYEKIIKGEFISRPNRFIAQVMVDGKEETVHVKNTGRCRELLVKGAEVYLSVSSNPARKTKYDLIAVRKDNKLINMDSQIPNDVAAEWFEKGEVFSSDAIIKREVTHGKSRFDFYIEDGERKIFLEVKGVTLERDGAVFFPDAPTERGTKHLNELCECVKEGYEAYALFVVQMKDVSYFSPNDITDPVFSAALRNAYERGVSIICYDCKVTEAQMNIADEVSVIL